MEKQTIRSTGHMPILSTKIQIVSCAILFAALFFLYRPALLFSTDADESCGDLLQNRCTQCHYLTRVCQKLEKNQKKGFFGSAFSGSWSRTIKNMVKQGAKLTEAEQEKLTECLDNSAPEALDTCGLKK